MIRLDSFREVTMRRRLTLLAALLLMPRTLHAEGGRFEKTIPFPRGTEATLDWAHDKCTVRDVQVRNYPDREDIEKARQKEHDDKSWLWWEFHLDNRGSRECKVRLWVEILDSKGEIVKASDRSGTVDPGKIDDTIRISTRMRTIDIADSPKVRLRAEIVPK
jgi:hypothetical protein